MKPKQKFNYKILDKKTGKFFTTGRSKSTWLQKGAVIDFIKSKTTPRKSGYYSSQVYGPDYKIDEIEVYIYPLDNATIVSASDFIAENQIEIDAKNLKKKQKEVIRQAESLKWELKRLEEQQKQTELRVNDIKSKLAKK